MTSYLNYKCPYCTQYVRVPHHIDWYNQKGLEPISVLLSNGCKNCRNRIVVVCNKQGHILGLFKLWVRYDQVGVPAVFYENTFTNRPSSLIVAHDYDTRWLTKIHVTSLLIKNMEAAMKKRHSKLARGRRKRRGVL